ncbi:hypothetical protein V1478_005059, partial [Vespula squamosa]
MIYRMFPKIQSSSTSAKRCLISYLRKMNIALYRRIMIPKIETRICTDWISDSSIDRNGSRNRPMLSHFEEKSIYKAKT